MTTGWPVLLDLFLHCAGLSLLAIGGAVATAPDLQRHVVAERGWISAADFTGGMALAQAAPGPNLLFVAVIGFQVAGMTGALAALLGMALPSTALTMVVSRWGSRHRQTLGVRAFVAGMAPITLGLIVTTGFLLAQPVVNSLASLGLMAAAVAVAWRTRANPLWLIGAGALAGGLGWV